MCLADSCKGPRAFHVTCICLADGSRSIAVRLFDHAGKVLTNVDRFKWVVVTGLCQQWSVKLVPC